MGENSKDVQEDAATRFEARALLHLDFLYNRALVLTGSPDAACTLVKETYVRAARAFANNGPSNPTRAWLLSILCSIRASEQRPAVAEAGHTRPPPGADGAADAGFPEGGEFATFPETEASWSSLGIGALLDRLPEELRDAIVLVDVDQLTHEDAAQVLRTSVSATRARLFRARRAMFGLLTEQLRARDRGAGADCET